MIFEKQQYRITRFWAEKFERESAQAKQRGEEQHLPEGLTNLIERGLASMAKTLRHEMAMYQFEQVKAWIDDGADGSIDTYLPTIGEGSLCRLDGAYEYFGWIGEGGNRTLKWTEILRLFGEEVLEEV